MFKRIYVKALLYIVSHPVLIEEATCPETLLLDMSRLTDLQIDFRSLTGRCVRVFVFFVMHVCCARELTTFYGAFLGLLGMWPSWRALSPIGGCQLTLTETSQLA